MGWAGREFNQNGDMLFTRGGDCGFGGAFIRLKDGTKVQIENPEVFEGVSIEKVKWELRTQMENALDAFKLKSMTKPKRK